MGEGLELVIDILRGGDHVTDHAEHCLSAARRRFQLLAGRLDSKMSFGESVVAFFKALTVIIVEPIQNAIVASASSPREFLTDRIELADNCWPAPRQRENDGDSPKPPEEIGARP